jgi:hypothetical protein
VKGTRRVIVTHELSDESKLRISSSRHKRCTFRRKGIFNILVKEIGWHVLIPWEVHPTVAVPHQLRIDFMSTSASIACP